MISPILEATQVGVGGAAVEAAAWVVLLGGIALTALWTYKLYS